MSISLRLDDKNNIVFGNNFMVVDGKDCLVQDIKTSLSMLKGEYPYDIGMGIDYLGYLRFGNKQELLAEVNEKVLDDSRVDTCDIDTSISGKGLLLNIKSAAAGAFEGVQVELE